MQMNNELKCNLITVIVDYGKGSKVVSVAKKEGVRGATITLGRGTSNLLINKFLSITEIRKEIVFMVTNTNTCQKALTALTNKFHLDKPNHGIIFTIGLDRFYGYHDKENENLCEKAGKSMYKAIFVIVDKEKGEEVVESATKAGAKGATIINARGSGVHEQKRLFNFPIEPEKEIVLMITKEDLAKDIIDAIRKDMDIDAPGMGILFVLDVKDTVGLIG
ncbi:TPA: P-II family nitrogen regulator [bacterium]|jgi:nitrogen regulatory protein PII|nr:P-II family nitrogen regulator [bacterium]